MSIVHPLHSARPFQSVLRAVLLKPKLASLFKQYCAHHDFGGLSFAAALTGRRQPSINSCPRFGSDGNRELSPLHAGSNLPKRPAGLDPHPSCDDEMLQLAVIFLLGHRGRPSWIARALQVLFGPRALGKQRGQLTVVHLRSSRCLAVGARLA